MSEKYRSPEQIVQEMIGDQTEHLNFKEQAEEVIERLKLELSSNYVRAVHALQDAEAQSWRGKYAEKIDEVVEMCLEQCGLDPRNIPEYYSELTETIKSNQEVIDFFYPYKIDLQSEIESGIFKFPKLEAKQRMESEGYTLPLFIPRVIRGTFISSLDKAYIKIFHQSIISHEALSSLLEKRGFLYDDSLIFVNPNLEMTDDEEMKKTFGKTLGVMSNKFGHVFGTDLKLEGFGLEEYMFFQTHNYLNGGKFADQKNWMSLAGEGTQSDLGRPDKTICFKADGIPFDFATLYDDPTVGTRILYKAR